MTVLANISSDGSLIKLEDIISSSGSSNTSGGKTISFCGSHTRQLELATIVSQVEHPILFRPFYMIHPCHTSKFMSEIAARIPNDGYLVTWLSTVAALIGLELDKRFAGEKSLGVRVGRVGDVVNQGGGNQDRDDNCGDERDDEEEQFQEMDT